LLPVCCPPAEPLLLRKLSPQRCKIRPGPHGRGGRRLVGLANGPRPALGLVEKEAAPPKGRQRGSRWPGRSHPPAEPEPRGGLAGRHDRRRAAATGAAPVASCTADHTHREDWQNVSALVPTGELPPLRWRHAMHSDHPPRLLLAALAREQQGSTLQPDPTPPWPPPWPPLPPEPPEPPEPLEPPEPPLPPKPTTKAWAESWRDPPHR
jgi:hypothetical protein